MSPMQPGATAIDCAASLDRAKFLKVLGMLGSAHDGERAAATNRACAMLADAGLTWDDVIVTPAATTGPDFTNLFSGFEGVFNVKGSPMHRPAPEPAPPPEPAPTRIMQGADIPAWISGTVEIDDERTTRVGKPMLVIAVTDTTSELRRTLVYGPINVFDERTIDLIRSAKGQAISGAVSQPRPGTQWLPTFAATR